MLYVRTSYGSIEHQKSKPRASIRGDANNLPPSSPMTNTLSCFPKITDDDSGHVYSLHLQVLSPGDVDTCTKRTSIELNTRRAEQRHVRHLPVKTAPNTATVGQN